MRVVSLLFMFSISFSDEIWSCTCFQGPNIFELIHMYLWLHFDANCCPFPLLFVCSIFKTLSHPVRLSTFSVEFLRCFSRWEASVAFGGTES